MAVKPKFKKGEFPKGSTATKEVIHYINEETGVDVKCKEIYKKKKEIIHYPFNREGKPKYKTVKRFLFTGFENNAKLPVGINKSATFGLGFTKPLSPVIEVILADYKIEEVHVVKKGTSKMTAKKLTLTEETLQKLHPVFEHINRVQKQDRLDLAGNQLSKIFPDNFKATEKKFVKDSVHLALDDWSQDIDDFSPKDKTAIKELFDKLVLTDGFLTTDALLTTKSKLDRQHIEDVTDEFKKLLSLTTDSSALEKKWQKFLGKHNWVFSYVFSFPIMLLQDEAYVGGKNLSNKNGKITDFLVKNSVTSNVAFLELKTHKTPLIGTKKAYRGNDVFPVSKDLTGGVTQVLDQRDNFQKEFYTHKAKTEEHIESINSKCVVLMGSIGDLKKEELKSFELFRSNSKDVEVVTFDELLARFENLQELMDKGSD